MTLPNKKFHHQYQFKTSQKKECDKVRIQPAPFILCFLQNYCLFEIPEETLEFKDRSILMHQLSTHYPHYYFPLPLSTLVQQTEKHKLYKSIFLRSLKCHS
jgi:hypothetical protein